MTNVITNHYLFLFIVRQQSGLIYLSFTIYIYLLKYNLWGNLSFILSLSQSLNYNKGKSRSICRLITHRNFQNVLTNLFISMWILEF